MSLPDDPTSSEEPVVQSDTPTEPTVDIEPKVIKPKLSGEKVEGVYLYTKTADDVTADIAAFKTKIDKLNEDLTKADDPDVKETLQEELKVLISNLKDPKSYISRLMNADEYNRRYADNQEYLTSVLSSYVKSNHELREAIDRHNLTLNKLTDIKKDVDPNVQFTPTKLAGKAGETMLISRLRGLCRIPLWNTGIWIVIKNIGLSELNEFFESIHFEEEQYGRLLGGHYYLCYDYMIKERAVQIIAENIVDSSLKDYDKSTMFEKAFDLNDYDVVLNAMSYMLYRDGIDMDIPCLNEDCNHIETVKIDLSKIKLNNYSLLKEKSIETILTAPSQSLTLNDIDEYKDNLNIPSKIFGENSSAVITCQTPSMYKYIETGKRITAKLMSGIHTDNIRDKKFITKLNSLAVYSYSPWVKTVEFDPHTANWTIIEEDRLIIKAIEDLIQKGDPILTKIQNDFITKSKISILCYPGVKCPKCGATPSDIKSEFYPADMQSVFFFLSSIALSKPGKNLNLI